MRVLNIVESNGLDSFVSYLGKAKTIDLLYNKHQFHDLEGPKKQIPTDVKMLPHYTNDDATIIYIKRSQNHVQTHARIKHKHDVTNPHPIAGHKAVKLSGSKLIGS